MTDNERFELLWAHYHRQTDENRAVNKSLEELRLAILQSKNLRKRCDKIEKIKRGLDELFYNDEI